MQSSLFKLKKKKPLKSLLSLYIQVFLFYSNFQHHSSMYFALFDNHSTTKNNFSFRRLGKMFTRFIASAKFKVKNKF